MEIAQLPADGAVKGPPIWRLLAFALITFSAAVPSQAHQSGDQGHAASSGGTPAKPRTSARFVFTRLVVNDLAGQTRFYREAFGYAQPMSVRGDINGRPIEEAIFFSADGQIDFILLAYLDGKTAPAGGMVSSFFTPDLEALRAQVLAAGGAIHWDIRPMDTGKGMTRTAFFTDPEGHLFQAVEKLAE